MPRNERWGQLTLFLLDLVGVLGPVAFIGLGRPVGWLGLALGLLVLVPLALLQLLGSRPPARPDLLLVTGAVGESRLLLLQGGLGLAGTALSAAGLVGAVVAGAGPGLWALSIPFSLLLVLAPTRWVVMLSIRTVRALHAGDLALAARLAERIAASRTPALAVQGRALLAEVRLHQGDAAGAEEAWLASGVGGTDRSGSRARLAAEQGRPQAARALLAEKVDPGHTLDALSQVLVAAHLALLEDDPAAASRWLDAAPRVPPAYADELLLLRAAALADQPEQARAALSGLSSPLGRWAWVARVYPGLGQRLAGVDPTFRLAEAPRRPAALTPAAPPASPFSPPALDQPAPGKPAARPGVVPIEFVLVLPPRHQLHRALGALLGGLVVLFWLLVGLAYLLGGGLFPLLGVGMGLSGVALPLVLVRQAIWLPGPGEPLVLEDGTALSRRGLAAQEAALRLGLGVALLGFGWGAYQLGLAGAALPFVLGWSLYVQLRRVSLARAFVVDPPAVAIPLRGKGEERVARALAALQLGDRPLAEQQLHAAGAVPLARLLRGWLNPASLDAAWTWRLDPLERPLGEGYRLAVLQALVALHQPQEALPGELPERWRRVGPRVGGPWGRLLHGLSDRVCRARGLPLGAEPTWTEAEQTAWGRVWPLLRSG